jgi:hypothetical protein
MGNGCPYEPLCKSFDVNELAALFGKVSYRPIAVGHERQLAGRHNRISLEN